MSLTNQSINQSIPSCRTPMVAYEPRLENRFLHMRTQRRRSPALRVYVKLNTECDLAKRPGLIRGIFGLRFSEKLQFLILIGLCIPTS